MTGITRCMQSVVQQKVMNATQGCPQDRDETETQGLDASRCSLGLERLGLEAVSRRFLERFGLVSVLKISRLGLGSRVS